AAATVRRARRRASPADGRAAAPDSRAASALLHPGRGRPARRRGRAAALQHLHAAGLLPGDRARGRGGSAARRGAVPPHGARPAAGPPEGGDPGPGTGHGADGQPGVPAAPGRRDPRRPGAREGRGRPAARAAAGAQAPVAAPDTGARRPQCHSRYRSRRRALGHHGAADRYNGRRAL
ncbi:MAG: Cell division protein FtsL, partial [uncultured Nocardioidaceae bacterium]